jgi:hypothetical protein
MGVIYKLKPEVKDYILNKKQAEPFLSCRKLVFLVEKRFQIKVSKSSINSLIKESDLSMPVGRRYKPRRGSVEAEGLGAILLKAADYLLGGSFYITEVIRNNLKIKKPNLLAKTESLLYSHLFDLYKAPLRERLKPNFGLWSLIDQRLAVREISDYLSELKQGASLVQDVLSVISGVLRGVLYIKVSLKNDKSYYLDAKTYTLWSSLQIPHSFSSTVYNVKCFIKKYFEDDHPFVLFMPPGYEKPINEFFDFIHSFDSPQEGISSLALYDNKLKEIETVHLKQTKKRFFIFGLWPWQYNNFRKQETLGEFKPFAFLPYSKRLYLANTTVTISHPNKKQALTLNGVAIKENLDKQPNLVILTNIPKEETSEQKLTEMFLSNWPNLKETFQDFSRRIELYTYSPLSRIFFSTESTVLSSEKPLAIDALLNTYLEALDFYVRLHFLPSGYEQKDLQTTKEQFYKLIARFRKKKGFLIVSFKLPLDYKFSNELKYACRRINERSVFFDEKRRIWCNIE